MSGLLQRLAARATGSAWALQSDARLPFAAVPGMPETQSVEPLEPLKPTASHRTPKTRDRAAAMPQPVAPLAATVSQEPTSQPARIHARQIAEEVTSTISPPVRPIPAAIPPSRKQSPEPLQLRDSTHASPTAMAAGAAPLQAPLAPMVQDSARHDDPPPLLPAGQMRSTATARQPQISASHPAAPRAAHAFLPLRQAAPAQAEPAEVHVHIGRIEVTAITQPQAPRRAARELPEPLSLDAYLARRKEPS